MGTKMDREFGKIIRIKRVERGLSQEQLAEKAELHRTYISQLERGIKNPTLKTIFRLSRALSVSPQALIERLGERLEGKKKNAQ
jgi:transcriptional regulator with XRE-family HTH domain